MTKEDIKILLVDDEKQFVDTLAERLSMRGFEARVAYDGPQALKAVEQPRTSSFWTCACPAWTALKCCAM